jgi:rod shape-determining protein MreC
VLDFDGSKRARRKDLFLAGCVLALAFVLMLLPAAYQRPIRDFFRGTVLRPFLITQTRLAVRSSRTEDLSVVRAQRDSLAALAIADATLTEENRQLRGMLNMRDRVADRFIGAEVVRLGTAGAESSFIVNVGSADGVKVGSPVITPSGLLGIVWEVSDRSAMAIDWSNPQFVASAMTADGDAYGKAQARRGRFREEDVIVLLGAQFNSNLNQGKRVVTSGRGDLFPRGIPLGEIIGIDEADTGWRKSYLIKPAVRPEEAKHVLVGIGDGSPVDLADVWNVSAPADTAQLPDTTKAPVTSTQGRARQDPAQ